EEGNEILRLPQLPSPRASQAAAPDVGGAASQRWWMPSTEQPRTPRLAERAPRLEDPGQAQPRRPSLGAERALGQPHGAAAAAGPPGAPVGTPRGVLGARWAAAGGGEAGGRAASPSPVGVLRQAPLPARPPAPSAPPPVSAGRKEARAADAPPPPPPMLGERRSVPGDEDRGMRALLHELDLRPGVAAPRGGLGCHRRQGSPDLTGHMSIRHGSNQQGLYAAPAGGMWQAGAPECTA
ncbi:unnamed protein product, partial [Prorocentrum cordatum]